MNDLPVELIRTLMLEDAAVYVVMVRICKRFQQACGLSIEALKDRFCHVDDTLLRLHDGTAWREETRPPTVIYNELDIEVKVWFYNGMVYREGYPSCLPDIKVEIDPRRARLRENIVLDKILLSSSVVYGLDYLEKHCRNGSLWNDSIFVI